MSAKDKIAKGRTGLVLDNPFFGSLVLRLQPKEDPTAPTMWTDGKYLGYNPEFVEGLSMDQLKGVLCHEVMHCALAHHTRMKSRDRDKWNRATDYVINLLITKAGMVLPEGGLLDQQYTGMDADTVYNKLGNQPSQQGGGNGKGKGKGTQGQGPSGEQGQQGNDPGGCGEVRPAQGSGGAASEAESTQQEADWKVAVAQAATQAKAMGNIPASLDRFVKEIIDPVLDWREILRRFVDESAKNDYSWFPPNRRHIYKGVILPSAYSRELKNVTLVMDTSGSIGQRDIDRFASELGSIVDEYQTNCKVIYCDSKVKGEEEFSAGEPIDLHIQGGGGTDFRPPFEYLEERGDEPVCLIYQTDGHCSRFPEEPAYPVLWMLTAPNEWFDPPFGEVIHL